MNNAVGGPQYLHTDMMEAAQQIILETGEAKHFHVKPRGCYSHGVLAKVLENTIPPRWKLSLNALDFDAYGEFLENPKILGALINENNVHWTAIVKHDNAAWYVDSLSTPQILDEEDFIGCILMNPYTYAITSHDIDG